MMFDTNLVSERRDCHVNTKLLHIYLSAYTLIGLWATNYESEMYVCNSRTEAKLIEVNLCISIGAMYASVYVRI
jgi:hypothetical protein